MTNSCCELWTFLFVVVAGERCVIRGLAALFFPAKGSARVVNQLPASVATFSTTSSLTHIHLDLFTTASIANL